MVVDSRGAPKTATGSTREWTPPSQQPPPQYPAVKPGEPVPIETVEPLSRETKAAKPEVTKQSDVEGSPPPAGPSTGSKQSPPPASKK